MSTILIIPLFIGTTELLLIGGLALLLFGGKKLPELMKGLGQGVQSFKKGMTQPIPEEEKQQEDNDTQTDPDSIEKNPLKEKEEHKS